MFNDEIAKMGLVRNCMVIMIEKMETVEPDIQNMNRVCISEPLGDLANAHALASSTST